MDRPRPQAARVRPMSGGGMRVEVFPYALALRRPFRTATADYADRRGWLLRLSLPDGAFGWGEAAPLAGHGGEDADAVPAALAALGEAVVHPDGQRLVLGTPPGWAPLHALSRRLFPAAPQWPCARAAFDLALADLLSRRAGQPLSRWLSRGARPRVALNAVIDAAAPEEAAQSAAAAVASGFKTLKVKLTADRAADERRLVAIRGAAGSAVALRADANGIWDVPTAIARLRALVSFDLAYVEQPVAAADVAGLARVRRGVDVPIAADEALLYPAGPGILAVLAAEAADVVVLKPTLLGGPSAAWAAALAAAERNVAVTVTTGLDSAVGRHGALAVAAALFPAPGACGLATGALLADDVGPDIGIVDGWAVVEGSGPGIGFMPVVPAPAAAPAPADRS